MAEPEWDEQTRSLALGHAEWDKCAACGGPAELCQDPGRQFDWRVPAPRRCHRTTALRQEQAKFNEKTNPFTEALVWATALREGVSG